MAILGSGLSPGAQTPDSQKHQSLKYQYHNAPEVAPNRGLAYDSNPFNRASDKFPVQVQELKSNGLSSDYKGYDGASAPKAPLILFGMKPKTFTLVVFVMVCIIVGAAVGGAVGGRNMQGGVVSGNSAAVAAATTVVAGASASATPTYVPLSDCPSSNGTTYTSSSTSSSSGDTTDQTFTKYCDIASPLSDAALNVQNITQAFVYSFDDCIGICAEYNANSPNATNNCTIAVYDPSAGNKSVADCWVGSTVVNGTITLFTTVADGGVAVAALQ